MRRVLENCSQRRQNVGSRAQVGALLTKVKQTHRSSSTLSQCTLKPTTVYVSGHFFGSNASSQNKVLFENVNLKHR